MTAPRPASSRLEAPFRWVLEHPVAVDGVLFGGFAALLALVGIPTLGIGTEGSGWLVFSVPMFVAGAFLRIRTGWATLAIGVLAVVHLLLGFTAVLGDVMIFYALYCATVLGTRRTSRLALVAAFFGAALQSGIMAVAVALNSSWFEAALTFVMTLAGGGAVVGGVWAIGMYQRIRHSRLELLRDQVAQAERDREQRAALAVAAERSRIAREMHDVVAHSLSVIIAQADGGRYVAEQHPERAGEVLGTIGQTGRSALADMRSLLGVLREDTDSSFGPQPGLAELPALITRVEAAGTSVQVETSGELADLPSALGLSAFRIVQEALTNVMKHAGPGAAVRVDVHRRPDVLAIDVVDDGRGHDPDSDGSGHGLTGMNERVSVHGGTLQSGPLPAGGYRVSARIPLSRSGRITA